MGARSWQLQGSNTLALSLQVLGEDLVLVKGQQERMGAGADVWANPVAYDKLGVRFAADASPVCLLPACVPVRVVARAVAPLAALYCLSV